MDLEFLNVAAAPPPPPTATRSAPSQVMRNLQTVLAGWRVERTDHIPAGARRCAYRITQDADHA